MVFDLAFKPPKGPSSGRTSTLHGKIDLRIGQLCHRGSNSIKYFFVSFTTAKQKTQIFDWLFGAQSNKSAQCYELDPYVVVCHTVNLRYPTKIVVGLP